MSIYCKESGPSPLSVANLIFNDSGSTVSNAVPLLLEGIKQLHADVQQKMADVEKISPFLSQKNQPSAENLALHYYQLAKDTTGLKKIGYQMAAKQMAISADSIHKKDKILFEQAMEPFLSGKQDSTKIPGFSEERKLVAMQYSANVATTLYTVANAFRLTLPPRDKALNDALIWVRSAYLLYQNEAILKLRSELEQNVRINY